jgi:hypothetical protein
MTGSGFSNVELPDPAKRGAKSTRKGKKSVAWQDDPEILKRLALVAELMLDGKPAWEIAKDRKVSLATAKRDIRRVRDLWKAAALEKLESLMGDSLATYIRVQAAAWKKTVENPDKADQYLKVILQAQERVDKMAGIGQPETLNVNLSGEVEVKKDIEQIRNERWEQVKDLIPEALKP